MSSKNWSLLSQFHHAQAQYWSAMPPYNLLWPLWSPALSPVNTDTGLATPLITELTNATLLPVQPVLAWDPAKDFAYAIYNQPFIFGGGLVFYHPYFGLNPWPPDYLVDLDTGLPLPLALPLGYELLPPLTPRSQIPALLGANFSYLLTYPSFIFGVPLSGLLTFADIWGLTL